MTLTIALQEMQGKQQHHAQNALQDMEFQKEIAQHAQKTHTVMELQHVSKDNQIAMNHIMIGMTVNCALQDMD